MADQSDEHLVGENRRGQPKEIARASIFALLLGAKARKDKRSRRPQIVLGGPEVDAVMDLADALAGQGREDDGAVQQIRAEARGRRRVLERALAMYNMGPEDVDDDALVDYPEAERLGRLLEAAVGNVPIRPVSAEQAAWFRRIAALEAGGPEVSYARLKSQVSDLNALERDVRARVDANRSDSTALPLDDDWWGGVCERLDQIFATESNVSDPIFQSGAAYGLLMHISASWPASLETDG